MSNFASLAFDELDAIQGGCNGPCANGNCASPLTSPLVSPLGSFGVGSSPADWDAAFLALSQAPMASYGYAPQPAFGQPVFGQAMYGQPVYGQPLYGPGSGTGTGGGLGNGMGPGPALVAAGSAPF